MTIAQLYNKLTAIPLFIGISGEDLAMITDRVHLQWESIGDEQPLIQADELSQNLVILLEGNLVRSTSYDGGIYIVRDLVKGVTIIEPEQLYGLTCRYRSSYRASGPCKVLIIPKDDIRQTLLHIPVWRINFLNHLAAKYNKLVQNTQHRPYNLREQILHFGAERPLSVRIRMTDMGRYLGAARHTISVALHQLQDEGLVTLHPNLIEYNYPNI